MLTVSFTDGITMPKAYNIETLVGRYYDAIYRLALAILDDPDAAADAAQDSFIIANDKLDSFRGDSSIKTWLYAIALNRCRAVKRKQATRQRLQMAWQVVRQRGEAVETAVLQQQTNDSLWQAVDALASKHRLPVILYYVHEMTASEIGEVLGIREGTVHSRLHYARQQLRVALTVKGEG